MKSAGAVKDIPVISLNILGRSERLVADHQSVHTSYGKQPVGSKSIFLTETGFEGDSVADKKHHGGNDKAICCYNASHFDHWKKALGFDLAPAAFGENLTLEGDQAMETNVFIGDRYQLGEALVEVSEPRGPCFVIGIRYNYKRFPLHLQETGFTGFYLRTIKAGTVQTGDPLIHLSSHPAKIAVQDVNRIRYQDPGNIEWLKRLVALEQLTDDWREKFAVLLRKHSN